MSYPLNILGAPPPIAPASVSVRRVGSNDQTMAYVTRVGHRSFTQEYKKNL